MKILLLPIIFLHICLNISSLKAQFTFADGFIVDMDDDTIQGKIMINELINYRDSVRFLEGSRKIQNTDTYYPDELIGFSYPEERFFRSIMIREGDSVKSVFAEELEGGVISLYEIRSQNSDSQGRLFVKKDAEDVIELTAENYLNIFIELTTDLPKPVFRQGLPFRRFELGRALERYNRFILIERKYPDIPKLSVLKSFRLNIPMGINSFDFNHEISLPPDTTTRKEYMVGLNLKLQVRRKYKAGRRPELNIYYWKGSRSIQFPSGVMDYTNTYESIGIFPQMAYYLPAHGPFQFYGSFGLGYILEKSTINFVQENQEDFIIQDRGLAITLLLGLRLDRQKFFIDLELGGHVNYGYLGIGIGF